MRFLEPDDSVQMNTVARTLRRLAERTPGATCSIFLMNNGAARRRGFDEERYQIKALFQGASLSGGKTIYPGDTKVRAASGVSIQIRLLEVGEHGQPPIATDVPMVAVWIPAEVGPDLLFQDQGGPATKLTSPPTA
jgi:hypothetical protein